MPVSMPSDVVLDVETAAHDAAILALNEDAFGPGRHVRAAARVRERGDHDRMLSFVATLAGELVGSVRLTPISIGGVAGHLLGPLAVVPALKHRGIGRALIERSCVAARDAGVGCYVLLVGDEPYYGRHGFSVVRGPLMPGPVDPSRLLVRWHGDARALEGPVLHAKDA